MWWLSRELRWGVTSVRRHIEELGVNSELLLSEFGWRTSWVGGVDQSVGDHPVLLNPGDQQRVPDLVLVTFGLEVHQLTRLNRHWRGRFVT